MDPTLSKADVAAIRKALFELSQCEQCLSKAEEAGIDCTELRARKDYEWARLTQLNQVYGTNYPAVVPK